jgi:hypothetical protein
VVNKNIEEPEDFFQVKRVIKPPPETVAEIDFFRTESGPKKQANLIWQAFLRKKFK